jgi:hypothetical protein
MQHQQIVFYNQSGVCSLRGMHGEIKMDIPTRGIDVCHLLYWADIE